MTDPGYRPERFFPLLELDMLAEGVAALRRRKAAEQHVMVRPDGSVWGFGAAFEEWREAAEVAAAFEAFRPWDWWRHEHGRAAWNDPHVEA